MTRKKVALAYIINDSARKATFKKRKKGIMKKTMELSTLCGVDICTIVYSNYDMQPETWPPARSAVEQVIERFENMPQIEQCKKMMNQETFLRQRITKAEEQLRKQQIENKENEMKHLMSMCLGGFQSLCTLTLCDLNDVGWAIEQKLKDFGCKGPEVPGAEPPTQSQTTKILLPPVPPHGYTPGAGTSSMGEAFGEMKPTMAQLGMGMWFGGESITVPFEESTSESALWSNGFFP